MPNVEENAFQIARYLLENPKEDGQVAIQEVLGFSGEDFGFGLNFLVNGKYCTTYGRRGGKDAGIRKNLAELQDFVNRINENRVPLSLDAERLLKFLFDSPTPASDSEQTINSFGWDEKRYHTALESLKFKEYIDVQYADNKPFDVWITNNGREVVRNNFRLPFQKAIRIETNNNDVANSKVQIISLTNRPLRVFLCHSSNDKPTVRELYQKLRAETWIQPWLDEEELYPGQDWNMEIEKAVEAADVIIVCLSKSSITKEGYVQKEIKTALDYSDYKPEGTVFIIPVRLEDCKPPKRLSKWQYADYFEGQRERAFQRLLVSLDKRADSLDLKSEEPASNNENKPVGEKPKPLAILVPPNRILLTNGMEFIRVPAGKFLMGSDNGLDNERPQHNVNITYDYWIGYCPVTNDQYNIYVQFKGLKHPVFDWEKKKDHPVVNVSWYDAVDYCRLMKFFLDDQLSMGLVMRLPSEAEWEKAARSTDGREYPWGNQFDKNKCNSSEVGQGSTTPVGLYSPQGDSPYGCKDMVGNVWEWTHSLNKAYPYNANDGREDEKSDIERVLRGGAYLSESWGIGCASRGGDYPNFMRNHHGFRVVVSSILP